MANKQYNTLKHDYEMTLHAHSSIVPCADGHGVPAVQCDFVPIAELENRDKDAIIGKQNKILLAWKKHLATKLADRVVITGLQLMGLFILKRKTAFYKHFLTFNLEKLDPFLSWFLILDKKPSIV